MTWLHRPRKTAFCAKCNAETPIRREPIVGKRGGVLKVKRKVCAQCGERVYIENKWGAKRTVSPLTGRVFHSKKEARREPTLLALNNTGAICALSYQVPYVLEVYGTQSVDALLSYVETLLARDASAQRAVNEVRRSRQRICKYISDFSYEDSNGNLVVEDVKGRATSEYRIKKRLMRACWNIEIVEPSEGGIQQKARGSGIKGRGTGSRLKGGC